MNFLCSTFVVVALKKYFWHFLCEIRTANTKKKISNNNNDKESAKRARQLANYALPVIVCCQPRSAHRTAPSVDCFAKPRNVVVNISASRKGVRLLFLLLLLSHIIRMANNCARRICCEIIMKHLQFAHGKRFTFSFLFLNTLLVDIVHFFTKCATRLD